MELILWEALAFIHSPVVWQNHYTMKTHWNYQSNLTKPCATSFSVCRCCVHVCYSRGLCTKVPAWSHQSFSKEDNFAHCTDGCFLSMARRRQIHILVQHYHSHADPGAPPFQSSEHMTHSSLDVEFRIRRQQLTNIRTCMLCCLNDITSSCT